MRAGASGFLLKDVRRGQLADAIRTAVAGDTLLAPVITRRLIGRFCRQPAPGEAPSQLTSLTSRELQVLRLVGRGHRPPHHDLDRAPAGRAAARCAAHDALIIL